MSRGLAKSSLRLSPDNVCWTEQRQWMTPFVVTSLRCSALPHQDLASKGQQQVASIKNDSELFVCSSLAARQGMETLMSSFVTSIRHVLPHCLMVEVSALVPRIIQLINHEFLEWSEY